MPAGLAVSLPGRCKTLGCVHPPALQARAFGVAAQVHRVQHLFMEGGSRLQHLTGELGAEVRKTRQVAVSLDLQDIVEEELPVLDRRAIGGHERGRVVVATWRSGSNHSKPTLLLSG